MKKNFLLLLLVTAIHVPVKGMVCSYCARGLNEVLSKQSNIARYEVNIPKGEVVVWPKKNAPEISREQIHQWIKTAGLD